MPKFYAKQKKRQPRKRAWYNRKYQIGMQTTPANMAKTAMRAFSMGKYALSLLNAEKKYFNLSDGTYLANDGTASIIQLNGIESGTDVSQRTGNSLRMKNLKIRGFHQLEYFQHTNGAARFGLEAIQIRHMLLLWQADTDPVLTDILDTVEGLPVSNPTMGSTTCYIYNGYKKENAGKLFKVIQDKSFTLQPMLATDPNTTLANVTFQSTGNSNLYQRYDYQVKLKEHVKFADQTDATAKYNRLILVRWCCNPENQTSGQGWNVGGQFISRVSYLDN